MRVSEIITDVRNFDNSGQGRSGASLLLRRIIGPSIVVASLATPACDKSSTSNSASPQEANAGSESDTATPVKQAPDPEILAQVREQYLRGFYVEAREPLPGLLNSLTQPDQVRARGLSLAWIALNWAEEVPENANEPAKQALAHARELQDQDIEQLARVANGAYLMGIAEYNGARTEFERALSLDGRHRDLARLFLAKALLNQAFDEQERIRDKRKLGESQKTYTAIIADGKQEIIKAHAEEGLAALAKFLGDREGICTHSDAASKAYDRVGASDLLREGPALLAAEASCESRSE